MLPQCALQSYHILALSLRNNHIGPPVPATTRLALTSHKTREKIQVETRVLCWCSWTKSLWQLEREKKQREKKETRWRRLTIWFSFWPWFLERKVIVFGTINAVMIRTSAMENTVSIAFTRGHQVRFWALSWNNLCRNMRVRFSFRSQGQRPFWKFRHNFWAVKHCLEQIWPFSRAT